LYGFIFLITLIKTAFDVGTIYNLYAKFKDQNLNSDYSGVGVGCLSATLGLITSMDNSQYYTFNMTPTGTSTTTTNKISISNAKDVNNFIYPLFQSIDLTFIKLVPFMSTYDPAFHSDASILSSYTVVGSKVSSWTNQYGGQLLTQAVDTNRPTLTTHNGLKAFAFNTTDNTKLENITGIPMSFGSYCLVYNNTSILNFSSIIYSTASNNPTFGGASNTLINGNYNAGGGGYTWINRTQVGTPTDPLNYISRTLVNNMAVQTGTFGADGSTGFSGNL
jgi:hypothetical protein